MRFSEDQRAYLYEMVKKWQQRLGLEDWRFRIDWDNPAWEKAILSIKPITNRKLAIIQVGSFFENSPEEQENAVAHELIHCILEPVWQAVKSLIEELSPSQSRLANAWVGGEFEKVVDKLADILCPVHGVYGIEHGESKEGSDDEAH